MEITKVKMIRIDYENPANTPDKSNVTYERYLAGIRGVIKESEYLSEFLKIKIGGESYELSKKFIFRLDVGEEVIISLHCENKHPVIKHVAAIQILKDEKAVFRIIFPYIDTGTMSYKYKFE